MHFLLDRADLYQSFKELAISVGGLQQSGMDTATNGQMVVLAKRLGQALTPMVSFWRESTRVCILSWDGAAQTAQGLSPGLGEKIMENHQKHSRSSSLYLLGQNSGFHCWLQAPSCSLGSWTCSWGTVWHRCQCSSPYSDISPRLFLMPDPLGALLTADWNQPHPTLLPSLIGMQLPASGERGGSAPQQPLIRSSALQVCPCFAARPEVWVWAHTVALCP